MKNMMTGEAKIVRRYLECAAFVLLWMACGFYFHLSPIAYTLLGLPLVAGFQFFVARRPLVQLWARDAEKIRLDGRTGLLALVLFATCATLLLHGFGRTAKGLNAHWLTGLMLLVGCAAFPAAVALREQRAAPLRRAFGWIALALVIRVGWRVAWAPTWGGPVTFPLGKLPDFFSDLICEAVAFFLVDEVAFRGALDPYLEAVSGSRMHAWSSAVFVSMLWSVWHLPANPPTAKTFLQLLQSIGPFEFQQVVWGPVLSLCARRSRTLVPSAVVHAAGNAYALTMLK